MVFLWAILGLSGAQGGHCVVCHPEVTVVCDSA